MEQILFDYLAQFMLLTTDEKKAILDLDLFKHFKKGTIILKEGEHSDYGYFVIKGCIRSFYMVDGEEKTTAFYTEAESIEPLCKINKEPSKQYISCVEDSILLVGNSETEQAMFQKFPRFETLCRVLSEKLLARNTADFADFKTSSPEQRYLDLRAKRPDLMQRVPQYQIASFLGITAQSLSRMRSRLVESSEQKA